MLCSWLRHLPILDQGLLRCRIRAQSDLAELIRQAELIVWDEAPMMARHVYEGRRPHFAGHHAD